MTVFHSLVVDKQENSSWLYASCMCGRWDLLDTDADRLIKHYQAHKDRAVKGEQ